MNNQAKVESDTITPDIKKMERELRALPPQALKEFVDLTPIKTGNARRKTKLQGDTIHANYPYAQRLDEGYSKQAPRGMIEPFEAWLKSKIEKILRK